jgi:hypothetical protein
MPNIFEPSPSNTPKYKGIQETPAATPYATDLLNRGQAFTTAATPVYTGQLTAGPSTYQNQAWQGLANLTVPKNISAAGNALGDISTQQQNLSYDPTKFTSGTFGTAEAQQYMNPYIEAALNPQLDLLQRRSAINQQGDMAKLAQAGAFGGSRQAILQGLNQENLLREQAATAGSGYEKAYNNAMAQFNADQARAMEAQKASEQSKQYGAGYKQTGLSNAANTEQARAQAGEQEAQYGLANLSALSGAGNQQQAQNQAALDAQYKEFLRQMDYPAKQLELQKGLITGLAPVLPATELQYGQKDPTAQTAASAFSFGRDLLNAFGIKDAEGLKTAASTLGIPVDKFLSILNMGPDTSNPASTGQTGLPSSDTGSGYTPDDSGLSAPAPGYHRDENGALVQDNIETVSEPDVYYENDGSSVGAEGGLVSMLKKMRGHK